MDPGAIFINSSRNTWDPGTIFINSSRNTLDPGTIFINSFRNTVDPGTIFIYSFGNTLNPRDLLIYLFKIHWILGPYSSLFIQEFIGPRDHVHPFIQNTLDCGTIFISIHSVMNTLDPGTKLSIYLKIQWTLGSYSSIHSEIHWTLGP